MVLVLIALQIALSLSPPKKVGVGEASTFSPCFPFLALKWTQYASDCTSRVQLAPVGPLHGFAKGLLGEGMVPYSLPCVN